MSTIYKGKFTFTKSDGSKKTLNINNFNQNTTRTMCLQFGTAYMQTYDGITGLVGADLIEQKTTDLLID